MATINLGRVKPVFKGAYSGATAYVVDDMVSDSGNTYICIAPTTGNAPPNATYWHTMAAGSDLGGLSGLAQGDTAYYNGTAWARLGAGTSGQYLETQGAGANPQWSSVTTSVLNVESYENNTRNTVTGSGYNTKMSGTFDKQSSSSKIVGLVTYVQFSESAGAGNAKFVFGSSSKISGTSYGNTAGHSKMVSNMFYINNNTATGSVSWSFQLSNPGGTVFNPSSSDDSRIDNNRASVFTIWEFI